MKASNTEEMTAFDGPGSAERGPRSPGLDALDSARTDILSRIDSLTSTVADAGKAAKDAGLRGVDATNRFAQAKPWQVAGIAAAVGFVVGAMIARR
jgi:ElaB/YqjD/DUF883 family membrane-anchored ribosome-binding protein